MDRRLKFLVMMVGFLSLGLVPTVICILFPPQLAIIENKNTAGINVSLNNWYKTRDYPGIDLPSRLVEKIEKQITAKNNWPESIEIEQNPESRTISILRGKDNGLINTVQFYEPGGVHKQTNFNVEDHKNIDIEKLNAGNYFILLEINGTVYVKKILIG